MKVQIAVDYQHILIAIVAALVGGATGYFSQQDPVAFLSSFDSWAHARPIVLGLVYVELISLLALAKKAFVEKTPDAPPAPPGKVEFLRRSSPPPAISYMPSSFPKNTRTMLALSLLAAALSLTTAGCAKWWTDFKNNPAQRTETFVQYVESFIQGIMTVWSIISPVLGSGTTAANAVFNDAMLSLHNALGLLLDAVHAAVEAGTPAPDFSKLMADVQDAVQRVLAVYTQYKAAAPSASLGAAHDSVVHQAMVIGAWRR